MKINNAELWSGKQGLVVCKGKKLGNLIVEIDSKVTMDLIGKNEESEHPISHIIEECKKIMDFL